MCVPALGGAGSENHKLVVRDYTGASCMHACTVTFQGYHYCASVAVVHVSDDCRGTKLTAAALRWWRRKLTTLQLTASESRHASGGSPPP